MPFSLRTLSQHVESLSENKNFNLFCDRNASNVYDCMQMSKSRINLSKLFVKEIKEKPITNYQLNIKIAKTDIEVN